LDFDAGVTAEHQSLNSPIGSLANHALPGYNRDQREYDVGGAASWEIDLAGGLRRNAAAARDELQAADAEQAGTRVTVAADAADAYLQVRGLQARLAVAQNQINTDAKLLKIVQFRYAQGEVEGREVAQAQALLQEAQATVPALRISLEDQLNRLGLALIKRFPICRDCDSNSVEVFDDDSALRDFGF
jgi:outer membrane protein TolC